MSITITTAEVKRKAMIASADTTHDADIAALITEMQPAIEKEVCAVCLANTADTGLQALLKLGMLEIISGELLEQLMRESGAGEAFAAAGVTIGAALRTGIDLIVQGVARLKPYTAVSSDTALSTTTDTEPIFGTEEDIW